MFVVYEAIEYHIRNEAFLPGFYSDICVRWQEMFVVNDAIEDQMWNEVF